MKRWIALCMALIMVLMLTACKEPATLKLEPQVVQMRSICELATMKCYYHNVAKFYQDGGEGWFGIDKKDKHFWIEYSGVVTIGVDASLITIEIVGDQVTITMPPATVQRATVDEKSLTRDAYIQDKDSADITARDEIDAFAQAQEKMEATAAADATLLANAQQRAQMLLEDYVTNVGNAVGIEYHVVWVYVDETGTPISSSGISATQSTEQTN